ncbi:unnamed protein product, partial [Ectocarpus sp. 12 AP-2014]
FAFRHTGAIADFAGHTRWEDDSPEHHATRCFATCSEVHSMHFSRRGTRCPHTEAKVHLANAWQQAGQRRPQKASSEGHRSYTRAPSREDAIRLGENKKRKVDSSTMFSS